MMNKIETQWSLIALLLTGGLITYIAFGVIPSGIYPTQWDALSIVALGDLTVFYTSYTALKPIVNQKEMEFVKGVKNNAR